MGRRQSKFLVGIFVMLFGGVASAQSALDFAIHQEYTSTRALGMGNAFSAVVDDHSAMFYNPSTLARREDGQIRMFLRAGLDADVLGFVNDVDAAGDAGPQEVSDLVDKNIGKHLYMRVPTIGAAWVRPGWGIAFIPFDLSLDIVPNRSAGPALAVNAYQDSTLAFSYARDVNWFKNKKHRMSVGATAKAIYRLSASKQVFAGQLANGEEIFDPKDAGEGLTADMDLGFLFTPDSPTEGFWAWTARAKPTFSFVVRNLIDHGFPVDLKLISDNSSDPMKLYRRFDVGSKLDLPRFWVFEPKVALDVRDMGHPNWTIRKGFHFGTEMYWRMANWWKGHWSAGINQGYWSAGFGARLAIFQIDIATWGEEVGTQSATKESRRYTLELSLDF